MAFKKKRHQPPSAIDEVQTHRTKRKTRCESISATSLENKVRQLLADKVNGNLLGLWLLVPEHLRLGTWELICNWTGKSSESLHPRLAMQLIHESALCCSGVRERRSLSQRGFELLNGLPFIAADTAIHRVLDLQTVQTSRQLQIALGKIRRSLGHFQGELLAVDPHRMSSRTQRQMLYLRKDANQPPAKMAQTFFCLDANTNEPLCFTSASSAQSVSRATPDLLDMVEDILGPLTHTPLVLADTEHHTVKLHQWVAQSAFDLFVPMPAHKNIQAAHRKMAADLFTEHWPGYATTRNPYHFKQISEHTYCQFIQRTGQTPDQWQFKSFLCSSERNELQALTEQYPRRWHVEQFFDNAQALGWKRAGTMNQNIQYGRMTLALFAQAASSMLKKKLPGYMQTWDSMHLAQDLFRSVEGDLRVKNDTVIVTLYNCPEAEHFKKEYENMPQKLHAEGVNSAVPWLYDLKIDFRFK